MAYIGNAPAEAYTNTVKDTFSGNGSTVAFTLSLPTTTNNVRVVVENVIQDPTVAYSVSGTTLTFTSAPPSGTNNIYVVHLGPAVQTVQPPTELSGNFTLTGDLTQTGDYALTGAASISGQLDTASILPTADATSVLGGASNRYTNLFLSGGVYLGGTGSANLLDDYEEGTFTATLDFRTSSTGSLSYGQNTFRYIKIGDMVFISGFITWIANNFSASSGSLQLEGLPFAAASAGGLYRGGLPITYSETPWTGLTVYQQAFRVEAAETNMIFNYSDGTDGSVDSTITSYTNIDSGGAMMITGTYNTA